LEEAGLYFKKAVDSLLVSPATRTRDLGGDLGTKAFAAEVVQRIG
jgi:3-isopropylmalate dehydrogenase